MKYKPELLPATVKMLDERRGTWPAIAQATGVTYRTIQSIGQGATAGPAVNTVERLYFYMRDNPVEAEQ